jgi:hypothetical protein
VTRLLTPVAVVVAVLYFLIDGLFLSAIRPLTRRLATLSIFVWAARWLRSLGPYPTLALFLIPVILLEPVKPIGFYLIASQHALAGAVLISLGEIVKSVVVERLFHISRDKLMSIRAFAWGYTLVYGLLSWLRSLPPWQGAQRRLSRIKIVIKRIFMLPRRKSRFGVGKIR